MISYRLLGPVGVERGGVGQPLTAAKPRTLLALLLVNANKTVSLDRIVDELWPHDPPETAAKAVQTYVSMLRGIVGEARLEHHGRGYRLDVQPGELDVMRFTQLVDRAEVAAGDHATRLNTLERALSIWEGEALEDVEAPFATAEAAHLEELRLEALEGRLECELALGREASAAAELERLAETHPDREKLVELAMLALYRSGRQADALALYRRVRERLVEELGLEPARALRELEQAMLRRDERLDASAAAITPAAAPPTVASARRRSLVAAAALAGVGLIGIGVFDLVNKHAAARPEAGATPTTAPTAPAPAGDLRTFVAKVDGFVTQSHDGRHAIAAIVAGASSCKVSPAHALVRLETVERNRQSLLDQLAALSVPAASDALLVSVRFQRAIQLSIASDWRYHEWLTALRSPCSPARASAGLRSPLAADRRATAAKQAFVVAFNPLARRFGLPVLTASDV